MGRFKDSSAAVWDQSTMESTSDRLGMRRRRRGHRGKRKKHAGRVEKPKKRRRPSGNVGRRDSIGLVTRTTAYTGPRRGAGMTACDEGETATLYSQVDVVATMAFGSSFCPSFGDKLLLPAFRAPRAALDNAFNMAVD